MTTQNEDNAPLKSGQFKKILIAHFENMLPEFKLIGYTGGVYRFLRILEGADYPVYEGIHVRFSLKHGMIDVSLSSDMVKSKFEYNNYRTGPMSYHMALKNIVLQTGITTHEESYYYHDGSVNSVLESIEYFGKDMHESGIKWLEHFYTKRNENAILKAGLEFLKVLGLPKTQGNASGPNPELTLARNFEFYPALEKKLRSVENQSRADKKQISAMMTSLTDYYYRDCKFLLFVRAHEIKMSHWVYAPSLLKSETKEPIFELSNGVWDLNKWVATSNGIDMVLTKYPDSRNIVKLSCNLDDMTFSTGGDWLPISTLDQHLDEL